MNEQEYYELYGKPPRAATWVAEAVVFATDTIQRGIEFIADQFREARSLNEASTPEEVRAYARSIAKSQPGFAQDLIAAANAAEKD